MCTRFARLIPFMLLQLWILFDLQMPPKVLSYKSTILTTVDLHMRFYGMAVITIIVNRR